MKDHRKLLKVCMAVFMVMFVSIIFNGNIYAESNSNTDSYIFPDSASRYLEESEFSNLSLQILNYAKNEIYARKGRIFKSAELRNYFEQHFWYQGIIQPESFNDATMLNQYEIVNAQLLSKIEHSINPKGYQLDQAGYSYDPVYQYIADKNTGSTGTQAVISAEDYQSIEGISDFKSYEQKTGVHVTSYAETDIDGDNVTELLTCSKDNSSKEQYFIWKKDQDMPTEVSGYTGEQEKAPVKALYYYAEKGMLVVYTELDSMETYSFYSIEDTGITLHYCVYQKKEGMKWAIYLYQTFEAMPDRRIKIMEYGTENDTAKKAAEIVWKGYIDKLSKFDFKTP